MSVGLDLAASRSNPGGPVWGPAARTVGQVPAITDRRQVIAVVVCHDGAAFLPRALAAVQAQTRPVDLVVGVDLGSRDATAQLLAEATARTVTLPRSTSFGDGVNAALAALRSEGIEPWPDPRPAQTGPQQPAPGPEQWLWLVHDDCEPAPQALARLLEVVDTSPSVAVAGCKQVDWSDSNQLLDVGFTTSVMGGRVRGIDVREVDQGQHDRRSDVMAVSTAGMLVRREVWEQLGGPDPALAHARDDLDLCRRARLAGHRVVVVPSAVVSHARARARGLREHPRRRWHRADRRDALHLRLAQTPLPLLPLALLWSVLVAPLRMTVQMVLKQPSAAWDELAALLGVLAHPLRWLRARRRTAATRVVPRRTLRPLTAGPRLVLHERSDRLTVLVRSALQPDLDPGPDVGDGADPDPGLPREPVETGPVPEELRPLTLSLPAGAGPGPVSLIGLGLVLAGCVAAVTHAVGGALGRHGDVVLGPDLLPAPTSSLQLWRLVTSSWRPVGLGLPGAADPWAAVLAVLSLPLAASPTTAVLVVLLGALPAAALSAWWAAGELTRSRWLRLVAALVWAASPPLLAAVPDGRLGAAAAHVVLPLAGLALARVVRGGRVGVRTVTAASGAGLALLVVVAGAPCLALPALLAVLVTAVLARARAVLVWTVLVLGAGLSPWWRQVALQPRLLLADPGAASGPTPAPPGVGWQLLGLPVSPAQLLGGAGGVAAQRLHDLLVLPARLPGTPAGWLAVAAVAGSALTLVLALPALVGPRWPAAAGACLLGAGGLAVALAAERQTVATVATGAVRGWPGPGLSVLLLGAGCAALGTAEAAARALGRRPPLRLPAPRRERTARAARAGLAGVAAVLLGALPALTLLAWSVGTAGAAARGGTVRRVDALALPAAAVAQAQGPAATRTLVLRPVDGTVRWQLARSGVPLIGQASAVAPAGAPEQDAAVVLPVLGRLLAGQQTDARAGLLSIGVSSVLLLDPEEATALALDASPGLVRVGAPSGALMWQVQLAVSGSAGPDGNQVTGPGTVADGAPGRPSRVRVLDADGVTTAFLDSSAATGRIGALGRLPSGAAGRRLVLAEAADPGWRATLDGRPLTPVTVDGWAQGFRLPATAGNLVVTHQRPWQDAERWLALAVVGLAVLVALPMPGVRRRVAGPPRRSAPVGRGPARREPTGPGGDARPGGDDGPGPGGRS